ncbi:MAG: SPOR domain-containing protein [Novosphingobium sp.]
MSGTEGTHEGEEWQDGEGEPLETEQLALADEDDRLPWLESAEDDEYEGYGNEGSGLLKLVLAGLLALVVIVGGIWWATHRNPDPALVADGSLVPAESGAYKEAPKNPGGKQFDGTGDTSFAVSEGQNRPAQLGGADKGAPPPAPNADPNAKPSVNTAPAASNGGTGVQVGAFSSKAAAEAGWSKLVGQANGALSGVSHRVIEGSADNGTIYRLQAVAGDAASANALCGRLKSAGIACQVK